MPPHDQVEISPNPSILFAGENRGIRFVLVVRDRETGVCDVEGFTFVARTPQELEGELKRLLAPPAHERVEPVMVIHKDGRWHACGQHFPRRSVSAENLPQLRVELWDALLDEPWSVFAHKTSLALVKAAAPMDPPRVPRCIIADWDPRTATWAVGRHVIVDIGFDMAALETRVRALLAIPQHEPINLAVAFLLQGAEFGCFADFPGVYITTGDRDQLHLKLWEASANMALAKRVWEGRASKPRPAAEGGHAWRQ